MKLVPTSIQELLLTLSRQGRVDFAIILPERRELLDAAVVRYEPGAVVFGLLALRRYRDFQHRSTTVTTWGLHVVTKCHSLVGASPSGHQRRWVVGSSASLNPSPSRLNPNTNKNMETPGQSNNRGAVCK